MLKNRRFILFGVIILALAVIGGLAVSHLRNSGKPATMREQVTQARGPVADKGPSDSLINHDLGVSVQGQKRQAGTLKAAVRPLIDAENNAVIEDEQDDWQGLYLPPGLSVDDLPSEYRENMDWFFTRLEDLAHDDIEEEENDAADPIFFSTISPDMNVGLPYLPASFSPYSLRIFATFRSTTENMANRRSILVKWHYANKELMLFEYFNILPEANFNYIWKEMDYWERGIYNVEIFELENNVRLLASGSFVVKDLDNHVSYLGTYPSLEMVYPDSVFYSHEDIYLIFNYANESDRYLRLSVNRIGSSDTVLHDDILLSAAQSGLFRRLISTSVNPLSWGSYKILLMDNEHLVGRSMFSINE